MDKKKTLIYRMAVACLLMVFATASAFAQGVSKIKFFDCRYENGLGKDSVTLFFNLLDADGKPNRSLTAKELANYLVVKENGTMITEDRCNIRQLNTGMRIPRGYTFSVVVDRNIPAAGKKQIYQAISSLVACAPDSSVYLSFFGDVVTPSMMLSRDNVKSCKSLFNEQATNKYLFDALYAKLAEFDAAPAVLEDSVKTSADYKRTPAIARRAVEGRDKNLLFIFTEGAKSPDADNIIFFDFASLQDDPHRVAPTVYAFYYTDEENPEIKQLLSTICNSDIKSRQGQYMPANDMNKVTGRFMEIVEDQMYDYAFVYKALDDQIYNGATKFEAEWKGTAIGEGKFDIGTVENPWPQREESTTETTTKLLIALLVTLLTFFFFFLVMKVLVPLVRSKVFEAKYYKKYVPDANVTRRTCCYCKQEIQAGQRIVVKCKHVMHVHCWQENGYKCAEYGQNCKTGIQSHVDWKELFTLRALKDCQQTMAGIFAGFISWVIYDLAGGGKLLETLAAPIVSTMYTPQEGRPDLSSVCTTKLAAFLAIGLLLGFFLSLVFRYNDEYRKKDWKVVLKVLGLSLLTSLVGVLAFAFGGALLCVMVSAMDTTIIPWYCSLPAYILFSVSVALALTIKSSIPMKSALLGGGISAIIGFFVLYFSRTAGQYNMLLNFIIYGGGLGAALVTVRMLAEKYFLVVMNGVKKDLRIPIHKWMNATGGGNKVTVGMTGACEICMNWEKSNKVAKEHAQLYIDHERMLPVLKPLATGVIYNTRAELPVGKPTVLSNGDTFKVGDTIFQYVETD